LGCQRQPNFSIFIMRYKLFISVLLTQLAFQFCTGQKTESTAKIKVDYTMYLNVVGTVEHKATLKANDSSAVYKSYVVNRTKKKNEDKIKKDDRNLKNKVTHVSINLNKVDTTTTILKKDRGFLYTLYSLQSKNQNPYIKEPIPDLNWKLLSEKKSIKGLSCYSAKTTFRGRTYFAWYAPSIPISFGPWKLNGLPGLIIEAKDDTNEVIFQAEKVSYNPQKMDASLNSSYGIIGMKKHLEKSRKKWEKQSNDIDKAARKVLSKLPKGTKMTTETTTKGGMELNFDDLKGK